MGMAATEIDPLLRNTGGATDGSGGILRTAVEFCKKLSNHIRIDTHHDNVVMHNAVAKLGFVRSGIIHLANGSPRIAYELNL
jgi:RimJ/RimL family protein N-acetyltransferase